MGGIGSICQMHKVNVRRPLWTGTHIEAIKGAKNTPNYPYLEKAPIEAKIKANNIMKIMKI